MTAADLVAALTPVVEALDALDVSYYLAGSIASSAHGIARATLDADLVADVHTRHVDQLVRLLRRRHEELRRLGKAVNHLSLGARSGDSII